MKKNILIGLLIFVGITVLGFATGEIQAFYNRTVGKDVVSSETDMFHGNKAYIDGNIQDLSRYKLELSQTTDITARQAIIAHINEQFANFDEKTIENASLRQFLKDIRNGNVK